MPGHLQSSGRPSGRGIRCQDTHRAVVVLLGGESDARTPTEQWSSFWEGNTMPGHMQSSGRPSWRGTRCQDTHREVITLSGGEPDARTPTEK